MVWSSHLVFSILYSYSRKIGKVPKSSPLSVRTVFTSPLSAVAACFAVQGSCDGATDVLDSAFNMNRGWGTEGSFIYKLHFGFFFLFKLKCKKSKTDFVKCKRPTFYSLNQWYSTEAEYSNHLKNIKKNIKAEPYSRPVKAASRVGLRIRLFESSPGDSDLWPVLMTSALDLMG